MIARSQMVTICEPRQGRKAAAVAETLGVWCLSSYHNELLQRQEEVYTHMPSANQTTNEQPAFCLPLARKYRPQRFSDLVGQEFLSLALCNAIKLGREPHAVIFSGVRGIGKTTVARIYAKTLNCENRDSTGDSCDRCESCDAVTKGFHEDVLEIDGASNTGIDDIRELQQTLDYIPIRGRYKVIIIDEVHSLSNSAFNALLKTLEEPPAHVVFAFATTEFDKIPKTIVSRCQTFFLKTFSDRAIVEHLKSVLGQEKVEFDEEALEAVARHGRGSMRDSLTHLDQVIAVGAGRASKEACFALYSEAGGEQIEGLLLALLRRNREQVLFNLESILQAGVEVIKICESLSKLCRNIFVISALSEAENLSFQEFGLGLTESEKVRLKAILQQHPQMRDFHRIFGWLTVCVRELDESYLDRYVFENFALQWCLDSQLLSLHERLNEASSASVNGEAIRKPLNDPARDLKVSHGAQVHDTPQHSAEASGSKNPTPSATSRSQPRESLFARIKEQASGDRSNSVMDMLGPTTILSSMSDVAPKEKTVRPVASPAQSVPLVETSLPLKVHAESTLKLPSSWSEMIDSWKKQKPIRARIFEDSFSKEFSASKIHIMVIRGSSAAQQIVNPQVFAQVKLDFEQLFGFRGELSFSTVDSDERNVISKLTGEREDEKTLLEKRDEAKLDQVEKTKSELLDHPLTRLFVERLGGTVGSVTVGDE